MKPLPEHSLYAVIFFAATLLHNGASLNGRPFLLLIMEKERTEREKTSILWAFVPAFITAVWAIGYTFHIWPSLTREKPKQHHNHTDSAARHRDSLRADSALRYPPGTG